MLLCGLNGQLIFFEHVEPVGCDQCQWQWMETVLSPSAQMAVWLLISNWLRQ
jgi:hypothetical protein